MGAAPWNLKILFAFLSDCVPIFGQRRKPYFFMGIVVQAAGWLILGLSPASIGLMAAMIFLATLGQVAILPIGWYDLDEHATVDAVRSLVRTRSG